MIKCPECNSSLSLASLEKASIPITIIIKGKLFNKMVQWSDFQEKVKSSISLPDIKIDDIEMIMNSSKV